MAGTTYLLPLVRHALPLHERQELLAACAFAMAIVEVEHRCYGVELVHRQNRLRVK